MADNKTSHLVRCSLRRIWECDILHASILHCAISFLDCVILRKTVSVVVLVYFKAFTLFAFVSKGLYNKMYIQAIIPKFKISSFKYFKYLMTKIKWLCKINKIIWFFMHNHLILVFKKFQNKTFNLELLKIKKNYNT